MIKIKIPATSANLGAGFDSLGLAVNLYNYVYLEESDQLDIKTLDQTEVPMDQSNLIYKAFSKVFQLCGKSVPKLWIRQTNQIPMTRGLGSSSACIVAGILGANQLLGEPLGLEDRINLAAQLEGHPDNTAPALLGGIVTAAFDGEKVHWVRQKVEQELSFFAIVPDFQMSTQEARRALPEQVPFADAVYNLSRAALFSASLLQGKYENLKTATQDRLHQTARLSQICGGKEILKQCDKKGAYASYISGAGPTLMAIVDEKNHFFGMQMREFLDQMEYHCYQILQLCVDNDGTQLYVE